MRRIERRHAMQRIRQEMAGYRMPSYVEEILTQNYCRNFMRMSIIRESGCYSFSYKPDSFDRLDLQGMRLYDKLLLLKSLIEMSENASEHLINAENYLLEPELIYVKGGRVDPDNIRLMFYPDVKLLDFRYKLVLFADRIMNKEVREEREMAEHIREAAEPGDINRIKLFLDKNIIRLENRMIEVRAARPQRA